MLKQKKDNFVVAPIRKDLNNPPTPETV
jgi:hypothetical protein